MIRAILLAATSLIIVGCASTGSRTPPPAPSDLAFLYSDWQPGRTVLRSFDPTSASTMVTSLSDSTRYGISFAVGGPAPLVTSVRVPNAGADPGGDSEIAVLRLGEDRFRRLATGADVRSPAIVSPDGATIGFRRQTVDSGGRDRAEVWLVSVAGGEPVRLHSPDDTLGLSLVGWSGEALWYAVSYEDHTELLTSDGRVRRTVGEPSVRDIRFSRDGSWLAYTVPGDGIVSSRIGVLSKDGAVWSVSTGLPFATVAWQSSGALAISLAAGRQLSEDLPFPITGIPASKQQIDLPVEWSANDRWLVVRRIDIAGDGTPLREMLGFLDRDGRFRPFPGDGFLEPIGWVGR